MATQMSYVPEANEIAYYEGLFAVADRQRSGVITGAEAVPFFSLSKLPMEALKTIWTVADQPPTQSLDKRKFAVAVRLIQLLQNEQKGNGPNLAAPPGVTLRPVTFEGVSGVSVPFPPQAAEPEAQAPNQAPAQQQQVPPRAPTSAAPPSPSGGPPPAAASLALTPQSPYSLSPTEQARYESLFPQYEQDGFVQGKTAFDLFSKSGVPQEQLAAIWRMVDQPVDNRLDKLEFAIAMHLIVCVSQKNMPCPPSLPLALKQLKSQQPQHPQAPEPQAPQPAPEQQPPAEQQIPPPTVGQQQSLPPPQLEQPPVMNHAPTGNAMSSGASVMSALSAPPPLPPPGAGTVSISDAFEGLEGSTTVGGVDSYLASAPPIATSTSSYDNESNAPPPVHNEAPPVQTVVSPPVQTVVQPPPTQERSVEPSIGLPSVASTDQPASGHRDELDKLKAVVQTLKAENIALKASMGSLAGDEEDVQRELSATVSEIEELSAELTTLRAQVLSSKSRLLEATSELKAAKQQKGVYVDMISEANATKAALEDATNDVVASIESMKVQEPPSSQLNGVNDADLFGFGNTETVESAPAPIAPETPVQNSYAPAPVPESVEQPPAAHPESVATTTPAPLLSTAPQPVQHQTSVGSYAYYGHQKTDSMASGFFGVMGGASPPPASYGIQPSSSFDVLETVMSAEEINELKSKSREADSVAQDAEDSRRQLVAQADELRRVSDEAERKLSEYRKHSEGKKKGLLGRGKKKDEKEMTRLLSDAKTKKDAFLQSQSQVNDATALARATKEEADKLRGQAEDAEVQAASVASMQPPQAADQQMSGTVPMNSFQQPLDSLQSQGHSYSPYAQPLGGAPSNAFNPSVMGGGGLNIPTPSGDPYANPFG